MAWLLIVLLSGLTFIALWRFARFDRVALQLVGSGLLIAMAGYAWQGRPDLPGRPVPPPARERLPETSFAQTREAMLGMVDQASFWLRMADSYHVRGDTYGAAAILRSGVRAHPENADLWIGLGNALVTHAGGMMTPAAQLAFNRAAALAPQHPGPKFFYGLALAQGGRLAEAESLWRSLLASAPADAEWRPTVEERLAMLVRARQSAARGTMPQR